MRSIASWLLLRMIVELVGLVILVTAILRGPPLPFDPRWLILGQFVGAIAIVLFTTHRIKVLEPGHPFARFAPEVFIPRAIQRLRWLAANARARCYTAIHRKRRFMRVRSVERAALQAAEHEHEQALAPQAIRTAAEALLRLVYLAWDARDLGRLATLMSPELLLGWQRALLADKYAVNYVRTTVVDDVKIDLVGLKANAAGGHTIIVLVEAQLDVQVNAWDGRPVPQDGSPAARRLCQYWTLTQDQGTWKAQAMEQRAEGDRHLSEPVR